MLSDYYTKCKQRLKFAQDIEAFSLDTDLCSYCLHLGRYYVSDPKRSSRCSECIHAKSSYSMMSDKWDANIPSLGV